jgi:hypothetical protein
MRLLQEHVVPALTPQKFVVTMTVHATPPLDEVKALVDQYRSIKDIPTSESALQEIELTLRDIASTLENLSTIIVNDIEEMFNTDEAFFPSSIDARFLGIEIERSTVVTDS